MTPITINAKYGVFKSKVALPRGKYAMTIHNAGEEQRIGYIKAADDVYGKNAEIICGEFFANQFDREAEFDTTADHTYIIVSVGKKAGDPVSAITFSIAPVSSSSPAGDTSTIAPPTDQAHSINADDYSALRSAIDAYNARVTIATLRIDGNKAQALNAAGDILFETILSSSPAATPDSPVSSGASARSSFTVAFWNVAKWGTAMGLASGSTAQRQQAYTSIIKEAGQGQMPDIMGTAEYSDTIDKDGTPADTTIMAGFEQQLKSKEFGYAYNNIFVNRFKVKDHGWEKLPGPVGDQVRTYAWAILDIYGHDVLVISTHIATWTSRVYKDKEDVHYKSRKPQFDLLAALIRKHKYVICMADYNTEPKRIYRAKYTTPDTTEYGYGWGVPSSKILQYPHDDYQDLGITMAFGRPDEHGIVNKYPVDNIVTKGFRISNVVSLNEDHTLSDHPLIACTLEFE